MKWNRNCNCVLLALIISGIAFLAGLHTGLQSEETTPTLAPAQIQEVEVPQEIVEQHKEREEKEQEQDLSAWDSKELPTIYKAAKRNNCEGENLKILLAIRQAENGRAGREFGVLHPKAVNTNLDTQAGWAAATVVKNRARWEKAGKPGDFITFLGKRYCPVDADNDPTGLNKHWIGNVKMWVGRI